MEADERKVSLLLHDHHVVAALPSVYVSRVGGGSGSNLPDSPSHHDQHVQPAALTSYQRLYIDALASPSATSPHRYEPIGSACASPSSSSTTCITPPSTSRTFVFTSSTATSSAAALSQAPPPHHHLLPSDDAPSDSDSPLAFPTRYVTVTGNAPIPNRFFPCTHQLKRYLKDNAINGWILLLAFSLLIASTGNTVMLKQMQNKMSNYPYFLIQLTTVVYLPVYYFLAWYHRPGKQQVAASAAPAPTVTASSATVATMFPKSSAHEKDVAIVTSLVESSGDSSIAFLRSKATPLTTVAPISTTLPLSKFHYFIIGLLDACSAFCVLVGGIHTSGPFQSLFNNAVIPITILLTVLCFRNNTKEESDDEEDSNSSSVTQYLRMQYGGAFLILLCILFLLLFDPVFSSFFSANSNSDANRLSFNLLYLTSTLFQALSSVYKEYWIVHVPVQQTMQDLAAQQSSYEFDMYRLQAYVATSQFLCGLCFLPLASWLPFLTDVRISSLSHLPTNVFVDGPRCFAGIDTVVNRTVYASSSGNSNNEIDVWVQQQQSQQQSHCIPSPSSFSSLAAAGGSCWSDWSERWGAPEASHCDDCTQAWIPTCAYLLFNFAYNFFIALLLKYGNHTLLLWFILLLRLPIVQILFTVPWFQLDTSSSSSSHTDSTLRIFTLVALFGIMLGLSLYRYATGMRARKEEEKYATTAGEEEGEEQQDC